MRDCGECQNAMRLGSTLILCNKKQVYVTKQEKCKHKDCEDFVQAYRPQKGRKQK